MGIVVNLVMYQQRGKRDEHNKNPLGSRSDRKRLWKNSDEEIESKERDQLVEIVENNFG